jgi:uncharacterized coiled-coil DUF342 family protein
VEDVQKLQLKIQALGESFSNKAVQYESQIADLRVELTIAVNQLEEANRRIADYEARESAPEEASKD